MLVCFLSLKILKLYLFTRKIALKRHGINRKTGGYFVNIYNYQLNIYVFVQFGKDIKRKRVFLLLLFWLMLILRNMVAIDINLKISKFNKYIGNRISLFLIISCYFFFFLLFLINLKRKYDECVYAKISMLTLYYNRY